MNNHDTKFNFLSLKKNLKKDFSGLSKYKIALLGDSATQLLNQAIRGYGYEVGLDFDMYEADYNQVEQEINTMSSGLYRFQPDFIVIYNSAQKLLSKFYTYNSDRSEFAANHITHLQELLETLSANSNAKIIYFNFLELNDYVFGNFGNKVTASFIYQIRKLNYELMNVAIQRKNLFIVDIASLSNQTGLLFSTDAKLSVNADLLFSLDFTALAAKHIVDVISPLIGRLRKCLILDLDNTMWGGVIGDDGIEGIQLGELGIGKAFTSLQLWAKELKQRGILLAVASKNTEAIAVEPFQKHPDMVLRLEDISVFVANWESKVDNIRYIQSILNIGFDSMVFLDDNPFERGLIRSEIPDVEVPELPEDPAEYVGYLRSLNLFETASVSNEDGERTRQYQQENKRVVLKKSFHNEEDYLASLDMKSKVQAFSKFNIPRVAQLTQRSNQFNLRTIRYSESDIAKLSASPEYLTFAFELADKFGDHGLIAALILKKDGDGLFIDTWVMSCRVLKRGMEQFIVNELAKAARAQGSKYILGQYIPTPKNEIIKDLYDSLHFFREDQFWKLDVTNFKENSTFINPAYEYN